jgi:hypothetical protein
VRVPAPANNSLIYKEHLSIRFGSSAVADTSQYGHIGNHSCQWPLVRFLAVDRVSDVVKDLGSDQALGELQMNSLRKKAEPVACTPEVKDCEINYSNEVTKEQVQKLDELVKSEFDTGEWVTVAGEA